MRPRKAEVEAMVALLDAEHADVEALAKRALTLSWDLAAKRTRYGLVLDQPGVAVTLHGPFETAAAAWKFAAAFPLAGPANRRLMVGEMRGSDSDMKETEALW